MMNRKVFWVTTLFVVEKSDIKNVFHVNSVSLLFQKQKEKVTHLFDCISQSMHILARIISCTSCDILSNTNDLQIKFIGNTIK